MDLKSYSIFHGPKSWNNTALKNAMAERNAGLKSIFFNYAQLCNPFKLIQVIFKFKIFNFYTGFTLLPISLNHYKIFVHFGGLDVIFLNWIGKKVILHFQGCDIRDRYDNKAQTVCQFCEIKDRFCTLERSRSRRKRFHYLMSKADAVTVSTPDLIDYIKAQHVYFIPKIFEIPNQEKKQPLAIIEKIRVVHAPSFRSMKGTDRILEILQKHTDKFEILLFENLPNEEVLRIAQTAHLAIDQIRVGWYGNFAVEMMALGIPVIAFIRDDLQDATSPSQLPIIQADGETLEAVLLDLFTHQEKLHQIGQKSLKFVSEFHAPAAVASRMKNIYKTI